MRAIPNEGDRGTTLIEMLIVMAVMSLATAMIGTTLILSQRVTNRVENSSNAIDAARLVSASLDRELRSAVCISAPAEGATGNTLTFETLASGEPSTLTYQVAGGTVTRTENATQPRVVITGVGTTSTAFQQVMTPLRTIVVTIPIRSANGGEFDLQTTIAGRNVWHRC
jgi:prepilin-type N-terminal cleavage/methylation domain-containing protein